MSDEVKAAEEAVVRAALNWHRNLPVAKMQAEELDLELACKRLEKARKAARSAKEPT